MITECDCKVRMKPRVWEAHILFFLPWSIPPNARSSRKNLVSRCFRIRSHHNILPSIIQANLSNQMNVLRMHWPTSVRPRGQTHLLLAPQLLPPSQTLVVNRTSMLLPFLVLIPSNHNRALKNNRKVRFRAFKHRRSCLYRLPLGSLVLAAQLSERERAEEPYPRRLLVPIKRLVGRATLACYRTTTLTMILEAMTRTKTMMLRQRYWLGHY